MADADFIEVAHVRNDTHADMSIHLEMLGEELVLSPGHEIDLLARPSHAIQPLSVVCTPRGLQVYAAREPDPDWHFRFDGRIYPAGSQTPTHLRDLDTHRRDAP